MFRHDPSAAGRVVPRPLLYREQLHVIIVWVMIGTAAPPALLLIFVESFACLSLITGEHLHFVGSDFNTNMRLLYYDIRLPMHWAVTFPDLYLVALVL